MKNTITVKVLLSIAGLVALGIGGALVFNPVGFQASADILLEENNVNLLSEIRSPGGVLLLGGVIMLLGVFYSKVTYFALSLSSLIYLGYGLGRLVSVIMDGVPHQSLLMATVVEFVVGGLSLVALLKFQRNIS